MTTLRETDKNCVVWGGIITLGYLIFLPLQGLGSTSKSVQPLDPYPSPYYLREQSVVTISHDPDYDSVGDIVELLKNEDVGKSDHDFAGFVPVDIHKANGGSQFGRKQRAYIHLKNMRVNKDGKLDAFQVFNKNGEFTHVGLEVDQAAPLYYELDNEVVRKLIKSGNYKGEALAHDGSSLSPDLVGDNLVEIMRCAQDQYALKELGSFGTLIQSLEKAFSDVQSDVIRVRDTKLNADTLCENFVRGRNGCPRDLGLDDYLNKTVPKVMEKRKFKVPTGIILSIMTLESGGKCNAVNKSDGGSTGLLQIHPGSKSKNVSKNLLKNPEINLEEAVRLLEEKYKTMESWFRSDTPELNADFASLPKSEQWRFLLAAFNGGEGHVLRARKELVQFVQKNKAKLQAKGIELSPNRWQDVRIFQLAPNHVRRQFGIETFKKNRRLVKVQSDVNKETTVHYVDTILGITDINGKTHAEFFWDEKLKMPPLCGKK